MRVQLRVHSACSQVLGVYVSLVMLRQVVAPHEAFLTLAAFEALVSCRGKREKRQRLVGCSNFIPADRRRSKGGGAPEQLVSYSNVSGAHFKQLNISM